MIRDSRVRGELCTIRSYQVARRSLRRGAAQRTRGSRIDLTLVGGARGPSRAHHPYPHPEIRACALAGHFHGVVPSRIQILGETELSYFNDLSAPAQASSRARLFRSRPLVRDHHTRSDSARRVGATPRTQPERRWWFRASARAGPSPPIHALLDDRLAPRTTLHGVLVDVFGVGLLLAGSSSIGKSECALDLVLARTSPRRRRRGGMRLPPARDGLRPAGRPAAPPHRGAGGSACSTSRTCSASPRSASENASISWSNWSNGRPTPQYDRMGVDDHYHQDIRGTRSASW